MSDSILWLLFSSAAEPVPVVHLSQLCSDSTSAHAGKWHWRDAGWLAMLRHLLTKRYLVLLCTLTSLRFFHWPLIGFF